MIRDMHKLANAPATVRLWLDTRGFPRTRIPTMPRGMGVHHAQTRATELLEMSKELGGETEFRDRTRMVLEELGEIFQAVADGSLVDFADAIGDLLWVVISIAETHAIPLERVWAKIVEGNFAKEIGGMKPGGWTAPDMTPLIQKGLTCLPPAPLKRTRTRAKHRGPGSSGSAPRCGSI